MINHSLRSWTCVRKNGLGSRIVAMLMLAVLFVSMVGFGRVTGGSAFAPMVVHALAAEGDPDETGEAGSIFDEFVSGGGASSDGKDVKITEGAKDGSTIKLGGFVGWAKTFAQIVLGVATIISIGALIVFIARMATAGSNEGARRKAQSGILWSGIALVAFGGLSLVVGFFWNLLPSL